MKESFESTSLLAIKIDQKLTKVFFFDIVNEKYHLVASSESSTTAAAPFNDVREGISRAIERVQQITGRFFYDGEGNIQIPINADGTGVDNLVVTFGFFEQVSVVSMGLLESISLESLKRLLSLTQLKHIDQIGMNDSRKLEDIIALFSNKLPDMVIIAGGVNEGAARSLMRQLEMLIFCLKLIPKDKRPYLVFSGNTDFEPQLREIVGDLTPMQMAANLRPSINQENLTPALNLTSVVNAEILGRKIGGFSTITSRCISSPLPISHSSQIMAKFLSLLSKTRDRNNLYIDFGRETIAFTAGSNGQSVWLAKNFSLNHNLHEVIPKINIAEIIRRSTEIVYEEEVKNYLWDFSVHPNSVPTTDAHLAIEKALISIFVQTQYREMLTKWPDFPLEIQKVIVTGEVFTHHMGYGDILLSLVDTFLPETITTYFLDQHGILPVLGVIAPINRYLPIHILDSAAISLLAKVIPFKSNSKPGTRIATCTIELEDGNRSDFVIEQGMIYRLPVPAGQMANLMIENHSRFDVDPIVKSFEKGFQIQGGLCGVVIDARGRPLLLPKDAQKRKEIAKIWRLQLTL